MNGIKNKNQLTVVKEYEYNKPLFQKIDCIIDSCYRDFQKKFFQTFKYRCIYTDNFKNY